MGAAFSIVSIYSIHWHPSLLSSGNKNSYNGIVIMPNLSITMPAMKLS